ncbi:MAG: HAMP domain-containing histidine kinase [Clostridia bacterium]|nr:HAMP domain-containing histidine kinase [Clostridia bacterium]
MLSLILLFVITLSVIMMASYSEIRHKSSEMLKQYVDYYFHEQKPAGEEPPEAKGGKTDASGPADKASVGADTDASGPADTASSDADTDASGPPDLPYGISGPVAGRGDMPPEQKPDYKLSTFYSVEFSKDGAVLSVNDADKGLYTEDDLVELATELLQEDKTEGRTGNLSYLIKSRHKHTLVAFIDDTVTETSMRTLLHNIIVIGGAAIVVLFFVSLVLSKKIIRPLEENDRRQKQFISDASHELKTPVAVIATNAEMLTRESGDSEWLSNIRYENERMGDLVRQLLELSRAENADMPTEDVDFSRITAGEALAFESVAFENGKTITTDIDDDIRISGSRMQLTQLVSVLLDNAIRHSTGKEINVSLERKGHTVLLNVINEAEEIPQEKQQHLFERFYRVDEARNSESHHYGLGLSIAKAVAEKHGGDIRVSCNDGKIFFTVSLPAKR